MPTERRAACLLCGGRCNPSSYTCTRCHASLWADLTADLVDDALWEARKAELAELAAQAVANDSMRNSLSDGRSSLSDRLNAPQWRSRVNRG